MDLASQRKIDRIVGALLCRLFSLFHLKKQRVDPDFRPKRILIILLSEMGSWVLAHAMFQKIKALYPKASVSVLLFKKNREIVDLLGYVPEENIITLDPSSISTLLADTLRIWLKMRYIRFDTVIDCELFHRIGAIFSYLSGAKIRVGFHPHTQEGLYRGRFINRPVLYNPYQHISQQFVTLVDAIDSATIPKAKRLVGAKAANPPEVAIAASEIDTIKQRLNQRQLDLTHQRLVLIYPGGGLLPIRAWPLKSFCRLAAMLIESGYIVGIIGLSEDQAIAETIVSFCNHLNCVNLTGFTQSIRQLMALFHIASLLITNDGGPGQFAALTPIPTIVFFGPETPLLYGALDNKTIVFHKPFSCSPCITAYNHRNSPCNGDNVCLKAILVEEVFEKARQILKK
jgi:ADP-heptose:LPS heptosyltransferase